jgi:hypothetical protein
VSSWIRIRRADDEGLLLSIDVALRLGRTGRSTDDWLTGALIQRRSRSAEVPGLRSVRAPALLPAQAGVVGPTLDRHRLQGDGADDGADALLNVLDGRLMAVAECNRTGRRIVAGMEGGCYRIDLAITTHLPVAPDDSHLRELAGRLLSFLPEGSEIPEAHTDPSALGVQFVAMVSGGSPADALHRLTIAVEHLAIELRRERGVDPMGPMPWLRSVCLTHVPGEEEGGIAP